MNKLGRVVWLCPPERKQSLALMYQEWCFTKLSFSCASILDPYIQMVLAMVGRHFLLMRRNWNVGRFVCPCGTKLEPYLGTFATALKCSGMTWEQSISTGSSSEGLTWSGDTLPGLVSPSLSLTKSLIVWSMANGTYLVSEVVDFYS